MTGEGELKRKLEEMLSSDDVEWVKAVTETVNAMYQQFELERLFHKTVVRFPSYDPAHREIGFVYKKPS